MNSGGDAAANLRVVGVHMDAMGSEFEDALAAVVSEDMRDAVRALWEEQSEQPIRRAHVLTGEGGPRPWFSDWDPSDGYYWRRLRQHLLDLGRSTTAVESIDDSSDKVLSHLEDPRPTGPTEFRVCGLVMGYVQSGKTANFSALIAKSADLGYKLVIVLSGLHNGLRQQTQRRLSRELGLEEGGVGLPEHGRRWIALTNSELHGDFRPGTVDSNVLQGNELVLLVVKKNASVLRRLVEWMNGKAPDDLPVLIIDDEADQASVNTGGNRPPLEDIVDLSEDDVDGMPPREDEIDPSAINRLIRDLVASFRRVSYVGYTATPFANVLINHEAMDREVFEDLYPRDFIVSLPKPNGYVGAERLFGREGLPGESVQGVDGLDVVRIIPEEDVRSLLPPPREAEAFEPHLPDSLDDALADFILATAGRMQREGEHHPSSMLVHTHFRTEQQNRLADEVKAAVTTMRQEWRYDRESLRPMLADRWDNEFRPLIASQDIRKDVPFEAIEEHVDRLFRDPMPVLVLNSTTTDVLDYEAEPSLKAILIGGNRLSRGLTLEGLVISYYVRQSPYFDTLLQMGRWFGFRETYVDLTRLWTTEVLASWFRDIALREEELRQDILAYERDGITPLEYGPKIRAHPAMLITAENKLGAARTVSQNYAGRLLQTSRFRLRDIEWLQHNLEATSSFLEELGAPDSAEDGKILWSDVPWESVDGFLANYRTSQDARSIDAGTISSYIREQAKQGELVRWRVAVLGQRQEVADLGTEDLGVCDNPKVNLISRTRLRDDRDSVGVLTSPARMDGEPGKGDEEIGLTADQIHRARAKVRDDEFPTLGDALRAERDPGEGLLLVYPVSRFSRPQNERTERKRVPLFDKPEAACTVIGVAFVFPASESAATVEYVAGSVGTYEDSDEE